MPTAVLETEPTVRVKLLSDQYMTEYYAEYDGRLPAGTVLDVDPVTANRWINKALIAEMAPDLATEREARRQAALEELARIDAIERGEVDLRVPDELPAVARYAPQFKAATPAKTVKRAKAKYKPKAKPKLPQDVGPYVPTLASGETSDA